MSKDLIKYICRCVGFKLMLFCFMPATASLKAQTDSSSIIKELTLDEEQDQEEEITEAESDRFIIKENRSIEWQPSLQRNIPDTVVQQLKKEENFWYADLAPEKSNKPENKKGGSTFNTQPWIRTLIWIIILGGFAFFLITYLGNINVGLFRKKNIPIEEEIEEMPEDIFAINYSKELDKATAVENYRLAVRLLFLQLLKKMSEKDIINYKQDKTNFDYLSDLYNTKWYKQFFNITRNYEYSWYGKFEIPENAFQMIRNDFVQFENLLS